MRSALGCVQSGPHRVAAIMLADALLLRAPSRATAGLACMASGRSSAKACAKRACDGRALTARAMRPRCIRWQARHGHMHRHRRSRRLPRLESVAL